MTTNEGRCEPPPEWRDKDGWHWVQWGSDAPECQRWRKTGHWYGTHVSLPEYRYLGVATPPAVVAALVEALEGLVMACELPGDHCEREQALPAARAALAAYREAGR